MIPTNLPRGQKILLESKGNFQPFNQNLSLDHNQPSQEKRPRLILPALCYLAGIILVAISLIITPISPIGGLFILLGSIPIFPFVRDTITRKFAFTNQTILIFALILIVSGMSLFDPKKKPITPNPPVERELPRATEKVD